MVASTDIDTSMALNERPTSQPSYWCHECACTVATTFNVESDEVECQQCGGCFVEELEEGTPAQDRPQNFIPPTNDTTTQENTNLNRSSPFRFAFNGENRTLPPLPTRNEPRAPTSSIFEGASNGAARTTRNRIFTRTSSGRPVEVFITGSNGGGGSGLLSAIGSMLSMQSGQGLPATIGDYAFGNISNIINQLMQNDPNQHGAPPASKSVVENLPIVEITQEDVDKNQDCAVCKDMFALKEEVRRLPCAHDFHPDCILPWLAQHNSCPVCRYELPTDDQDYENHKHPHRSSFNTAPSSSSSMEYEVILCVVDEGSINAVAVLVDELRHDDPKLRLQAMKKVQVIASALGPQRTRDELLPFLNETLDDDDEILLALAEELGEFVDLVGGAQNAYHLLFLLETLVAVDEAAVRDMACKSMVKVVKLMPPEHISEHFVAVLRRLVTREWFTSRIAACNLFQVGYDVLSPTIQAEMRGMFSQLCRDDLPLVRKAASSALGPFAVMTDPATANNELMPLFIALAQDRQDSVRLQTVDNAVALAQLVPEEIKMNQLIPIICTAARDSAWRVRWSVGNKLPEICQAFGPEVASTTICEMCFVPLLGDTEAEVKTIAASKTHTAAAFIHPNQLVSRIIPSCATLARDPSEHVRASLASVVMKMAIYLGRENAVTHLLPLFLQLLSDENSEVRLNIISNLDHVNEVVGIDQLTQSLLPAIVQLAEDRQWRIRLAIIEFVPTLASQLGVAYFEEHLMEMCMGWLCDSVFSIREAATLNLLRLTQHFGVDWARQHIVPRIFSMHSNPNYLYRMISLRAVKMLAPAMPSDAIQATILPIVLELATDPVPNIRFNVAKTLEAMVTQLDASVLEAAVQPCLQALVQDPDSDVQYFASHALRVMP
ncbi:phosphatase 2 [Thraustotheca clavata]|uniref:Phosphatase 2 n=1 Tax=Thraustotheca clavata TaxID=74557 RepID=A0A1W0AAA1_9STRA|nr:phosphatase 2 [Thraustotheca clavata]